MSDPRVHVQGSARVCEHADVRYFKDEKGAVACMDCGRLFGHLAGVTFRAYNPSVPVTTTRAATNKRGNSRHWWRGIIYGSDA